MPESGKQSAYPLKTIYFYLTQGCNLRCRHCWLAPKYQDDGRSYPMLDVELFRSIITQAKFLGLNSVKLTGGEPFLHPKIIDLIRIIRREEIELYIETNGVLFTPEIIGEIATLEKPFLAVSLDGAEVVTHEWIRGVKGCFKDAVDCIKSSVSAGINTQVILTIMRRNMNQMEALIELSESLGVNSVKFNILQPTARGKKMYGGGEALSIEELINLGRWVENDLLPSHDVRIYFDLPLAFRPLGRIYGVKNRFCGVCGILSIIGVLADGSYALCGIGEQVPEMVFGHASSDRLEDVWNNHPVLGEIRTGLPNRLKGVCADCLMKAQCLGSCIAQNYYRCSDIWAPYWFCEEAMNRELFPESRLKPGASIMTAEENNGVNQA